MAADLRERVARAIARDENGDETGWQAWRNEAYAVLAELGLTQAEPVAWQSAMEALVRHIERETCTHDETYRGGAIWEICRDCGAKWADDKGGKPEFKWPECVETARAMLAAAPQPQADVCPACEGNPQGENNPCHVCGAVAPTQPQAFSGLALAAIGVKHFGNPIPAEWYAAAKELLAAAPQPQPQASAEDVETVDEAMRTARDFEIDAWQRIRASLGVVQ